MEHSGLVWLYRLIKEPGRLWRRYLVRGLAGVALCVADIFAWRLGLRRHIA
jgi:N-acetylglucosaminyldiphosphoundecaprenol N-acetyl-beta-D-mannosaminyltransferase